MPSLKDFWDEDDWIFIAYYGNRTKFKGKQEVHRGIRGDTTLSRTEEPRLEGTVSAHSMEKYDG